MAVTLLGAILAGGQSSRFGSDKAVAIVDGLPLIDHVVMGVFRLTDHLVICGRDWRDFTALDDGRHAGEGPLAGLLAALRHASSQGFDGVVSAPCDALPVPDLRLLEGDGPAVFTGHWLFGFWPVELEPALSGWLAGQPDRSMRGWLARCEAREVDPPELLHNFNTPDDLRAWEASQAAG